MVVRLTQYDGAKAGKSFFVGRLAKELQRMGVSVTVNGRHDIAMEVIRIKNKSKMPIVLRLDGCYYDSESDHAGANLGIAESASRSVHVVCQSKWGQAMVCKYLGIPKEKTTVILNGADPRYIPPPQKVEFKYEFVTASKWRPHKRLEETVESFLLADVPDSCLRVFGVLGNGVDESIKDKWNDKRIIWHGPIYDHSILMGWFRNATAMIHLCMGDCCPNSVVEATCQHVPTICNNITGTPEIVGPAGGFVLDLDAPHDDLRPLPLYNPPKIDTRKVAEAITACVANRPVVSTDHVDIRNAAVAYRRVFERHVR